MPKNITVCRFEKAQKEGWISIEGTFAWAWRVDLANDNTLVGVCNGRRKQAVDKASAMAKKTKSQQSSNASRSKRTHYHV